MMKLKSLFMSFKWYLKGQNPPSQLLPHLQSPIFFFKTFKSSPLMEKERKIILHVIFNLEKDRSYI